ncbi:hypothetical protein Vadar_027325 [Vaccinium darrowii]|uniref:Uncharacterized protein n=1 Tax=Vaccinium darrowii TaxID=229202 RepID=A0ACB7XL31_9ERIC|nr:hypothetical protein Vadar_027325 [Vaccinium darrowii]
MVDEMGKEMKRAGYLPTTSEVLLDIDEEDKEDALNRHSEKLAIAFALLKTPPGTPIRIVKNLRVKHCSQPWILTNRPRKFDGDAFIRTYTSGASYTSFKRLGLQCKMERSSSWELEILGSSVVSILGFWKEAEATITKAYEDQGPILLQYVCAFGWKASLEVAGVSSSSPLYNEVLYCPHPVALEASTSNSAAVPKEIQQVTKDVEIVFHDGQPPHEE